TPKSVVSFVKRYTPQKYYNTFVLEFLRHEHLAMGSALVQYRKSGEPYITKKSLKERVAPYSKEYLASFTIANPDVFRDFRDWARANSRSLGNSELAEEDLAAIANYLSAQLREIPPGPADAKRYHRLCASILELLLYPQLISPTVETEINKGRKRIDIMFDNAAGSGFFHRVHTANSLPAQFIFVECKNYTNQIANPEIDQLIGRFSVNHGKVGLMLFRKSDDIETLLTRCSDAYLANQGLVVPIGDSDIHALLRGVGSGEQEVVEDFFARRYRNIAVRGR